MLALDARAAYYEGTKLVEALQVNPEATRMALVSMVADLVQFIDAKKTLHNTDDFIFTADSIQQHLPGITLEEIRLAFQLMKQGQMGKLYERLKTPEIIGCLESYLQNQRREMVLEVRRAEQQEDIKGYSPHRPAGGKSLAALLDQMDIPEPKRKGLGTQIRERHGWSKEPQKKQLPCSAHDKEQE